jgi:hypothetical protein
VLTQDRAGDIRVIGSFITRQQGTGPISRDADAGPVTEERDPASRKKGENQ